MKSRIKSKLNKIYIKNNIFKPLENNGLKLSWVRFKSGYYIFNFGKKQCSYF